ncbi:hypothetical protein LR032_03145 [Candidatus Bipolaricaulota bacterium]|nr:hypothetical protein [Candidatus Bipolaricaulota bacterium]
MRNVILATGIAVLLALSCFGAEAAQVLIVDQTESLMESMQVEVLARVLLASGLFSIRAVTEIPDRPHPSGLFDYVVVIPPSGGWIWVCIPGLPQVFSAEFQQSLSVLEGAIEQIFIGERQAANPADDLYSFIWSAYFLSVGILEGAQ